MKITACVLLFIAAVYAKNELKVENTCKNPIMTISASDKKKSGPIDGDSVVNIKYTTHEETKEHGDFYITLKYKVFRWVYFAYIPLILPKGIIEKDIAKQFRDAKYVGDRTLHVNCMFKTVHGSKGHCLPRKGTLNQKFVMKSTEKQIKEALKDNKVGSLFSNGWYKVELTGKTSFGKDAFCVQAEFEVKLDL